MNPRHAMFALSALIFVAASDARARVEANSGYSKAQTFSAALRYVRVDRGYEVVEKDPDSAYLLFRYPVPGRSNGASGSVEVVDTTTGVKIYVQLPQLPAYHETVLRDGLLQKLREEYGEPPQKPPPRSPPKSEGDAGHAGSAGSGQRDPRAQSAS